MSFLTEFCEMFTLISPFKSFIGGKYSDRCSPWWHILKVWNFSNYGGLSVSKKHIIAHCSTCHIAGIWWTSSPGLEGAGNLSNNLELPLVMANINMPWGQCVNDLFCNHTQNIILKKYCFAVLSFHFGIFNYIIQTVFVWTGSNEDF